MNWFIIVIFFKATGAPEIKEGWYPLEVSTRQECLERAYNTTRYLEHIEAPEHRVFCKETTEEMLYEYLHAMRGRPV